MILTCQNPKCAIEFNSRRSNKRFCCNDCYLQYKRKNPSEFAGGQFKKGVASWNKSKEGDTTIRSITLNSGNSKRLRFIRLKDASGKMQLFRHDRYVWEKKNGPIPKGHVIYHSDGRELNDDIDNLECIPFGEAMSLYLDRGEDVIDLNNQKHVNKLIKGCIVGRRKSQKILFEMMYSKMIGVAMRYTHDRDSAQDIISVAFLKIFDKIKTFKSGGSLEGWVRRIVVNTAIDSLRKSKRMFVMDGEDISRHEYMTTDEDEFEFENAKEISGITSEEVIMEIQKLSPRYRAVFNLFVIEGYTHKEISDILGIVEGTSKSNLVKSKLILKKRISELIEKKKIKEKKIKEAYKDYEQELIH